MSRREQYCSFLDKVLLFLMNERTICNLRRIIQTSEDWYTHPIDMNIINAKFSICFRYFFFVLAKRDFKDCCYGTKYDNETENAERKIKLKTKQNSKELQVLT